MLPPNTNMLIHNGNPMLNVEQYKRYLALQTRLHGNSMLNVEEYSEYVQLHTQFQDSIFAQPTVSNELTNQRDVENNPKNPPALRFLVSCVFINTREASFINSKSINALWVTHTAWRVPWLVRDANTYGSLSGQG